MGEEKVVPAEFDMNAKWDACLDLAVRRFVYSSLAGGFAGSPVTRWASVAFGAGWGISSAYTECSLKFEGSPPKLTVPKTLDPPASQIVVGSVMPIFGQKPEEVEIDMRRFACAFTF
ncbi:MICOS complex subunit Mic10 [Dillenia turbinata]|uniref:MICOS complex subunit Mic10 n=1 Tax=Dillenia turbinata TaxID=194707 RepID=A0AAN8W2S9_9MAGN